MQIHIRNQCLSQLMLWVRILLRQGILDTTLCDKSVSVTGQWFSPSTLISSTNKTDHHDITEILLKVALNAITPKCISNHFNVSSFQFFYLSYNFFYTTFFSAFACNERFQTFSQILYIHYEFIFFSNIQFSCHKTQVGRSPLSFNSSSYKISIFLLITINVITI
jgi:hypothetical protein